MYNASLKYQDLIDIDPRQIHLWYLDYECAPGAALIERYRSMLSAAERDQAERFYFPRDRLRYLLTRALVRTVLSRYTGIEAGTLAFATNAFGKPRLCGVHDTLAAPIGFNVSHTHSLIVLAVACGDDIGVDVENASRDAPLDIARNFFAPDEAAQLQRLAEDQRGARFFEYWTLKESYIKARGMGLSLPLHRFRFELTGERISLHVDPALGDQASCWRFWQLRLDDHYLVALCVKRAQGGSPVVTVRRCMPLVSEAVSDYRLLCGST